VSAPSSSGFAQTLSDFWLYNLEIPLYQLGLGNPNIRFLVITLGTAGLLWWIRPKSFFFEKTGKPRPNRIAQRDNPDSVVLGGRLHETMRYSALYNGGASPTPTTIAALDMYNGIVQVYANGDTSTTSYFQFDTNANILAAFPQLRGGDVIVFWIQNSGLQPTIFVPNLTQTNGSQVIQCGALAPVQNQLLVAACSIVPVLMQITNVPPVAGGVPTVVFYASFATPSSASPIFTLGNPNATVQSSNIINQPQPSVSESQGDFSVSYSSTGAASLAGAGTLTANYLANGFVVLTAGSETVAYTVTTDTSANIITQIQGISPNTPPSGTTVVLRVYNNSGVAVTIAGGSYVTVQGGSIATGEGAELVFVIVNSTVSPSGRDVVVFVM